MLDGRGLDDRAAEAEPHQMGLLYFQRIEKLHQVLHQQPDRVIARSPLARTVTAQVVTQDPEAVPERRKLAVPQRQVVGDAGDERHPLRAASLDLVIRPDQTRALTAGELNMN